MSSKDSGMNMRKIFFKYLGRYCVIFAIVLISSGLLVVQAYKIAERNVMEENGWRLRNGIDKLENQMLRMSDMTDTLQKDQNLNYLKNVTGDLKNEEYVYLNYLKQQISQINILYEFADAEFVLFRKNACYVSNSQASDDFESFYGDFFSYNDMTEEEFRDFIFSQDKKVTLIQGEHMTYTNYGITSEIEKPVLCVIHPALNLSQQIQEDSVAVVYVLNRDQILELLFQQEQYNQAAVQIFNNDGKTVFSNESDSVKLEAFSSQKENRVISYEGSEGILRGIAVFSSEFVQYYILELVGMLIWYAVIGLSGVIFISLFLAVRQYRSMSTLLSDVVTKSGAPSKKAKNEYDLLSQTFTDMAVTRDEYRTKVSILENQMKNSILANAFLLGLYTEDEKEKFRAAFPVLPEYYCVAVVKMNAETSDRCPEISLGTKEWLNKKWDGRRTFLSVLSGDREIILVYLRSDEDLGLTEIREDFQELQNFLTRDYHMITCTGISSIGKGLENIHVCCHQAETLIQVYDGGFANVLYSYYEVKSSMEERPLVDLEFLQKLSTLILCTQKEAVAALFEHLQKSYHRNKPLYILQKGEIFFAVRNILNGILMQINGLGNGRRLPEYEPAKGFGELLGELRDAALDLCDCIEENKKSRNEDLRARMLDYLQENFRDPGLTASRMSQEIGISEKYLFQFIKEQTGSTFSACLQALRLDYAEQLLRTTKLNNAEIAEKSGFGSANTFYRVFANSHGLSPGKYRESLKNTEQ